MDRTDASQTEWDDEVVGKWGINVDEKAEADFTETVRSKKTTDNTVPRTAMN